MNKNIIQAGVQIVTQVEGSHQIDQFIQNIQQAAGETSQLSNEAEKLAQEWRQAQSNQELIKYYQTLNQKIGELPNQIQAAREEAERLKQAWQDNKDDNTAKMAYVRQAKDVKALEQNLIAMRKRIGEAQQAMKQAGIDTHDLANQQKALSEQANLAQDKLGKLNQKANELNQLAKAKSVLGLDVDKRVREEIKEIQKAYVDLASSGTLSHKELARAAELQRDKIYRLEKSLSDLRPTLRDVAEDFQGVVSQAGGLTYVANEAIKFESAMAQVKKVTEGTPQQYADLSNEIKKMAGELGIMPAALAEIAAAGGQAGLSLEKLPEFTKMAAQMSVAFKISADEAGDMAAKISNVFGLQMNEMQALGDAINTLGNKTAAKEAEIADVLMRIGGNAKQFGLAAEEAAALGAAFVSLGKSPEVAGTAINAMLSKLQTSTKQGSEFKNALKDIGLSAEEMAANIAANPQAALSDFLARLEKLDKKTRSMVLSDLFGAEFSDDLALLTEGLNTYTTALSDATNKLETMGAMEKEVAAALNTTQGKIEQAKGNIAATSATLGETLLPLLRMTAEATGGVANAIGLIAEEFPLLAQLAVIFATGKVAVAAYQMAVKLAGTESVTAMGKTNVSVNQVRGSLKGAAVDAKLFGMSMQGIGDVSKRVGTGLSDLANNAAMLGAAFVGGFSIGEVMYQEFAWVRAIGDELGRLVAYSMAIFTDDTWENVSKHYQTYAESEREQAELKRQTAKATEEKLQKEKQAAETQAQQIKQLNDKYRDLQDRYNGNETSLRALTAAGKENSAWADDLREKNKQLEQQLAATKAELGKMNAQISDVSPLAKNRQALSDLGLTAEQVATGISKSAQTALDDFALAAKGFGNDADSMAMIFQAAVKKMDSPEALAELKKSLTETGQNAGLTAEQINQIAQSAPQAGLNLAQISKPLGEAEKAAQNLGIELQNAFSGSSPAMQAALTNFTTLRGQLAELAAQGFDVGFIVQQSLLKMTETAQSKADIDSLKSAISSLEHTGVLSFNEIERAILSADMRLQEIKGTIDPTEAAFKKLGIQTKEAMRLSAEETRLAFEAVKSSGQATSDDLKKAFEQTANDLLATGDSNQRAWVESQAAAYDYKVTVDSTGKAALQSAADTKAASDQKVAAHKQEAEAAKQVATANQQAAESTEQSAQAIEKEGKALSELGQKVAYSMNAIKGWRHLGTPMWAQLIKNLQDMHIDVNRTIKQLNADMENGANLAQSLSRAEAHVLNNAHKLDKVTLSNLNSAIAKARQQMQALADEAANAQAAAEKRLLQAQGKDDEVQKMEQQAELKALREQQEKAQKMGNKDAVASYQRAIAATQKAFEEERQRQAREREQQQREEAERQREQEQRQREQTPNVSAVPIDVNVQTDVGDLIDALKKRDDLVASQAVENLMSELQNALSQQR